MLLAKGKEEEGIFGWLGFHGTEIEREGRRKEPQWVGKEEVACVSHGIERKGRVESGCLRLTGSYGRKEPRIGRVREGTKRKKKNGEEETERLLGGLPSSSGKAEGKK